MRTITPLTSLPYRSRRKSGVTGCRSIGTDRARGYELLTPDEPGAVPATLPWRWHRARSTAEPFIGRRVKLRSMITCAGISLKLEDKNFVVDRTWMLTTGLKRESARKRERIGCDPLAAIDVWRTFPPFESALTRAPDRGIDWMTKAPARPCHFVGAEKARHDHLSGGLMTNVAFEQDNSTGRTIHFLRRADQPGAQWRYRHDLHRAGVTLIASPAIRRWHVQISAAMDARNGVARSPARTAPTMRLRSSAR